MCVQGQGRLPSDPNPGINPWLMAEGEDSCVARCLATSKSPLKSISANTSD